MSSSRPAARTACAGYYEAEALGDYGLQTQPGVAQSRTPGPRSSGRLYQPLRLSLQRRRRPSRLHEPLPGQDGTFTLVSAGLGLRLNALGLVAGRRLGLAAAGRRRAPVPATTGCCSPRATDSEGICRDPGRSMHADNKSGSRRFAILSGAAPAADRGRGAAVLRPGVQAANLPVPCAAGTCGGGPSVWVTSGAATRPDERRRHAARHHPDHRPGDPELGRVQHRRREHGEVHPARQGIRGPQPHLPERPQPDLRRPHCQRPGLPDQPERHPVRQGRPGERGLPGRVEPGHRRGGRDGRHPESEPAPPGQACLRRAGPGLRAWTRTARW